jgi:hypothetical protein
MNPEGSDGDRLSAGATALVELARTSLGPMSERQRASGLSALRDRLAQRQSERRRRWSAIAAVTVAAGGAAVTMIAMIAMRHRALSIRVEGGTLEASGGVVAATPADAPVLRFSDGSEVALRSGSHVRVRSVDDRGARITIDEGEAHVYVVHAPETRWAFEAGPFVVAVTGTAFGLSWQKSATQLDVRLENGSVTVTGPPSDAPLSLHSGQWLTVRTGEVRIRALRADAPSPEAAGGGGVTDRAPEPVAPVAASEAVAAAEVAPAEIAPVPAPVRTNPARPSSAAERVDRPESRWPSELAAGQFQAIVDQAVARGLDVAFAQTSGDELSALAAAARYTRRAEIARGALQAERRRFAGSERARAAAFFLGRMADAEGDARAALGWFDAYLAEAPNGTYAPEALGRKMTLVEKLEGKAAARGLAESYLRRFPGGEYARAANALLSDAP